ncbi:hypothetical protein PSHT_04755 [Puccinia striiformis]|uniref:Uncharacterized protein n=1 Tax=Puccinia striiformis TaxID=27350 RepID=A0A2S4WC45_9BASI|nr:hypothetical protein PSHT_04755 [Puccinia striiformis]
MTLISDKFLKRVESSTKKIIDTRDSCAHTIRLKRGFAICSVKGFH